MVPKIPLGAQYLTYSGWTYCSTRSHDRRLDPYCQPREPTTMTSPPVIRGKGWRENWSQDLSEQTESRWSSDNQYKYRHVAPSLLLHLDRVAGTKIGVRRLATVKEASSKARQVANSSAFVSMTRSAAVRGRSTVFLLVPVVCCQKCLRYQSLYSCHRKVAFVAIFSSHREEKQLPQTGKLQERTNREIKRGFNLKLHLGLFFNQPLDCRWRSWSKRRPVKQENFLSPSVAICPPPLYFNLFLTAPHSSPSLSIHLLSHCWLFHSLSLSLPPFLLVIAPLSVSLQFFVSFLPSSFLPLPLSFSLRPTAKWKGENGQTVLLADFFHLLSLFLLPTSISSSETKRRAQTLRYTHPDI